MPQMDQTLAMDSSTYNLIAHLFVVSTNTYTDTPDLVVESEL